MLPAVTRMPDWRESFERDGFVVMRELVNRDLVEWLRESIETLIWNFGVSAAYDSAKKLPAAHQIAEGHLYKNLAKTLGIAEPKMQGIGIRIDVPGDRAHKAPFHQEISYQPGDGIGFWTPLAPITEDMGPLEIASASHKDGVFPLSEERPEGSAEPYARLIENEAGILSCYDIEAPILECRRSAPARLARLACEWVQPIRQNTAFLGLEVD